MGKRCAILLSICLCAASARGDIGVCFRKPLAPTSQQTLERLGPPVFLAPIALWGKFWADEQRDTYRATARPLNPGERATLSKYFDARTLDRARIAYADLQGQLGPSAKDGAVCAMTFDDTIVVNTALLNNPPKYRSVLFHELVHVVQYEQLGKDQFINRYIDGWSTGGYEYRNIPLEEQAHVLQRRFVQYPGQAFTVRDEVQRHFHP